MPLDADDLIEPTLIEKALGAVGRDPGLSFVSPLAVYFEDDPNRATGGWVPLGLDRDLLLVRNIGGASGGSLIRREAALEPGVPLDVRWRDGVIEIEPQPLAVTLKRKGRLLVASPTAKVSALQTATVERTRRDLSTRRGRR
jgi:hypothetical protein